MVRDERGDDRLPGAVNDLRALVFGIRPSVPFSHSEDSSVLNDECCILDRWLPAAVDQALLSNLGSLVRIAGKAGTGLRSSSVENSGWFGVKQGPGQEECYDAQQINSVLIFHGS